MTIAIGKVYREGSRAKVRAQLGSDASKYLFSAYREGSRVKWRAKCTEGIVTGSTYREGSRAQVRSSNCQTVVDPCADFCARVALALPATVILNWTLRAPYHGNVYGDPHRYQFQLPPNPCINPGGSISCEWRDYNGSLAPLTSAFTLTRACGGLTNVSYSGVVSGLNVLLTWRYAYSCWELAASPNGVLLSLIRETADAVPPLVPPTPVGSYVPNYTYLLSHSGTINDGDLAGSQFSRISGDVIGAVVS